ncbi:MAG: transglutaminase-like domain-containing protein [Candidatus Cloacimonetes bacterium]|nr:transglutaminase-like domain-containing protein [Candidatus Cloacimonadota bacterium]MDD4559448.1 transglutaminase-like domain-containing protein [Candidatus Cloacimonadota bacterium]
MRKIVPLLILIVAVLQLNGILPKELQKSGNPTLYTTLQQKAGTNLNKLPRKLARSYREILQSNDDILMAYLLAYEADSKLAEASPQIVMENYQAITDLLQKEGMNYSAEFFLSYIAKQSVSDERLSPYRKAMLEDGLQEVLEISDPLQRYRAVASWCVGKMLFMQTSGRDQSPLDITRKSLTGRCEEMQILFVAAARTVGLPSRPASTPWWAHMDNNHAWAEVFLDAEWHYTGDMDAAYFPDQTWFSGMIDKTVLILAEGSLAAEDDEVLIRGNYDTIINSTANYAKDRTRRVEIICVDEDAKPLADVQVAVMVYNWGALRPIIYLRSDANGRLGFSTGSGDFYLSAYKDAKHALSKVTASEVKKITVELVLIEQDVKAIDAVMNYPGNEMVWREAPLQYQEEIASRKEAWQSTIDAWQERAKASPVPDSLALIARGNLGELEKFWQANTPVDDSFIGFLMGYDPKFMWQADAQLLEAVYRFWQDQDRDAPPELIMPSVFYEELPRPQIKKAKAILYPDSFRKSGKTPQKRMDKALKWQKRKYKIDGAKALSGQPRLDVLAAQKYLSDTQYRMLAIYILRANGIPAQFTRLPDNILVYRDDDWQYYDLKQGKLAKHEVQKQSSNYLDIMLTDADGVPINNAREHFTPTRFVEGAFYDINASVDELGAGRYRLAMPESEMQLNFGYRISDSKTAFKMIPITPGTDSLQIVAQEYPRTWEKASQEMLQMLDDTDLTGKDVVIFGNIDQENSMRIAQKLLDMDRGFVFYGYTQQGSHRLPGYVFNPVWQDMVHSDPGFAHAVITLYRTAEGWRMYEGIWSKLP